ARAEAVTVDGQGPGVGLGGGRDGPAVLRFGWAGEPKSRPLSIDRSGSGFAWAAGGGTGPAPPGLPSRFRGVHRITGCWICGGALLAGGPARWHPRGPERDRRVFGGRRAGPRRGPPPWLRS